MIYSETDDLCYVCLVADSEKIIRCGKCKVPIHEECADLFDLEKGATFKKVQMEQSVYSQVRQFPQLKNSLLENWFNTWICEKCQAGSSQQTPCHFCKLRDGFLVKITFKNQVKGKEERDVDEYQWAHLNCILKLYGTKPPRDRKNKCYILESDELAKAPECKKCEAPFKMDVRCRMCEKFYAHNLCLSDEKMPLKICNSCNKMDDALIKLDSNSSGIYIRKFFEDLLESKKYDDFCGSTDGGSSKQGSQKQGKGKKVEENKEGEENEKEKEKVTDHYMELNSNNELVYSFPFLTEEMFLKAGNETSIEEEENKGDKNMEFESLVAEPLEQKDSFQLDAPLEVENIGPDETLMRTSIENNPALQQQQSAELKPEENNAMVLENVLEIPKIEEKKKVFKLFKNPSKKKTKEKEKVKPKTLNKLVERIGDWHYISSIQILKQLQKVYLYSIENKIEKDKVRLTKKWYELLQDLQDKGNNTCLKSYDEKMVKEITTKFSLYAKYRVNCETWPMIPQTFRRYEWVEDYVPSMETESFKKELNKTITSKKTHCCPKDCKCSDLSTLGPYSLEKQVWETECPGRAGLMECDENCGCDLTKCKNKSITMNQRKMLSKDLKETFCWGIDYATHNNILLVLPDLPGIDRNDFIENKLLRAVHLTDTPWDMTAVCKQIILESRKPANVMYTKNDRKLAKMLIRAIKFVTPFDSSAFRLHTKGYGVICIKPEGIAQNDLIAEYFGEIYTPWRWFEKQDLIKKYSVKKKMKDELPDFYNIMLEKHKDDPEGYDILILDPINKGNYSSRLSHSCDSNCGTVTTIARGKYGVAMYSLKDISFGEELTFDYFSVTENEKEYQQAICLCGSQNCRIHYLNLITSKNQTLYLEKTLTFLELNYLLFYACLEPLTEDDMALLNHYSIRGSILDGCPTWLVKWTSFILRFIQEEREEYVNFFLPQRIKEAEEATKRKPLDLDSLHNLKKYLVLERISLESDRIQNLAITLNKVKYVLGLMKDKKEGGGVTAQQSEYSKPINKEKKVKKEKKPEESSKIEEESLSTTALGTPAIQSTSREMMTPRNDAPLIRNESTPRAKVGMLEEGEEQKVLLPLDFFDLNFRMRIPQKDLIEEEEKEDHLQEEKEGRESSSDRMEIEEEQQQQQQEVVPPRVIEKEEPLSASKKKPFKIVREEKEPVQPNKEELEIQKRALSTPSQSDHAPKARNSGRKLTKKPSIVTEILPPVVKAPLKKVCKFLWIPETKDGDVLFEQNMHSFLDLERKIDGFINEVIYVVKRFNVDQDKETQVEDLLKSTHEVLQRWENDPEAQFYIIRRLCLELSHIIRIMPKSNGNADWKGISDMLYFHSLTFTYYIPNDHYTSVTSEKEVTVRKCDIPDFTRYFEKNDFSAQDEANVVESDIKKYESSYVWAQLSVWWKQAVDKPEQTLKTNMAQDSRGTLCYPSIRKSFVDMTATASTVHEYPYKTRENWLKKIVENPYEPWPSWPPRKKENEKKRAETFKEPKLYGTFLLDCFIEQDRNPDLPGIIVEEIDKSDEERKKLFDWMNSNYFGKINYTLPFGL